MRAKLAADVDDGSHERVVHGKDGASIPRDAGSIVKGVGERAADGDAGIFDQVMLDAIQGTRLHAQSES